MKGDPNKRKEAGYRFMIPLLCILMGVSHLAHAQDQPGKIKPKLRLGYIKTVDGHHEVKASVYYIQEGERIACEGAPIGFYTDEEGEALFKEISVNDMGEAILLLDEKALSSFEYQSGNYYFFAQIEQNDQYQSKDAELEIRKGQIRVEFIEEDTLKLLKAYFTGVIDSTGQLLPVKGIPLKVYVKRALSLLPVGGDFTYTDKKGMIEIPFPMDIPGDTKGGIKIVVKLDEDDDYGTVQIEKQVAWGVPVTARNPVGERTLIGARDNAPLFMVVTINLILIGIWGYLIYLVYGLFRIWKAGKQAKQKISTQ